MPAMGKPTGAIPSTGDYGKLLARVVKNGRVDYALVAKDRAVIDAYLAKVMQADVTKATDREKLAFYVNAYNAATMSLVLKYVRGRGKNGHDLAGVTAVKSALGKDFFGEKEVIVSGKILSLNELEKLGRDLGDPRIHFAVNCASISCPPLLDRPWKVETLDADLTAATKGYFASPQGLQIRGGKLAVSKLLDWYKGDFGGAGGVVNFLRQFAPDAAKAYLDQPVEFLDYDWGLNKQK